MLRALALALLFPLVVSAQTSARIVGARGPIYPGPALKLPLSYSGAPFDCLGAASCVYWNGSALVDVAGLAWTQNGAVPQVAANALPVTAAQGAAGPFSDANYYSYGTGADPLDSTGDRWGCAAFVPDSVSNFIAVSNGLAATAGYHIQVNAGSFVFSSQTPTQQNVGVTGVVAGGFNVGCWWSTGTTTFAKVNLGSTGSRASGTQVAGTAYPLRIGRYEGAGAPVTGTILAVVQGLGACPTPPAPFAATCEGWAIYQMTRSFGLISTFDGGVVGTRTTTNGVATNEVNGIVWNVPNNVPRVAANGLLVERASTNYILNNRAHPKTTEAYTHGSTGAYVAWHTGTGTMTVTAGTATVTGLSCTAVAAGTLCPYTVTVPGTMLITTTTGTITAQAEPGSTRTSEIVTAGVAATRNADVATVPWPTMPDINRWCVKTTVTPQGGRAWDYSNATDLVAAGTAATANSFRVVLLTGAIQFRVYDSAGTLKNHTFTPSWAAGSAHTLTVCNASGTASVYADGAPVALSVSGTGTNLWASAPATVFIAMNSAGTGNADAYSRNVTICKGGSAAQCR